MKDVPMAKASLKTEVTRKYYLLNILQTLLETDLLSNVKAEPMKVSLYDGNYSKK
tara:strand:- start:612 stop:776 length:165 start_codon:yes stop_codon:yes gene_type:complete